MARVLATLRPGWHAPAAALLTGGAALPVSGLGAPAAAPVAPGFVAVLPAWAVRPALGFPLAGWLVRRG